MEDNTACTLIDDVWQKELINSAPAFLCVSDRSRVNIKCSVSVIFVQIERS